MRELSRTEISQVSGGSISDFATEGGAYGSMLGGLFTNTMGGALRGGAAGALIGASFGLGYTIGSWAYEQLS